MIVIDSIGPAMNNNPHKWRDMAWKEVLCDGAQSAIEYLMPDLAADMDPAREMAGIPGMDGRDGGSEQRA